MKKVSLQVVGVIFRRYSPCFPSNSYWQPWFHGKSFEEDWSRPSWDGLCSLHHCTLHDWQVYYTSALGGHPVACRKRAWWNQKRWQWRNVEAGGWNATSSVRYSWRNVHLNMCRAQLYLKLEESLDCFPHESIGNHHVFVKRDCRGRIESLLMMFGAQWHVRSAIFVILRLPNLSHFVVWHSFS